MGLVQAKTVAHANTAFLHTGVQILWLLMPATLVAKESFPLRQHENANSPKVQLIIQPHDKDCHD